MRLHLRSIDDPALLVADGANDRHGLRAQLAHDDLIAGTGAGERLLHGSLQILAPQRAFPVRGIDLDEVGEIRVAIKLIVRGAMIDEPAGVHAIRRLSRWP